MAAIYINIIAIIFCLMALIIDIINDKPGWIIVMILLLILNVTLLIRNIEDYNNSKNPDNVVTTVVYDVKGYQVDSTITINGTDTTKTYILTYWE